MRLDRATNEKDEAIHEAAMFGLDAVLRNQHKNGAWSQVFDGADVRDDEPKSASYPHDWPESTLAETIGGTIRSTTAQWPR